MTADGAADKYQNAATLLSVLGAGIMGLGVGIILSASLNASGWALVAVGAGVHGAGMLGTRFLQGRRGYIPTRWETAGYWLCWVGLGVLGLVALVLA